jgi:hypothetical protein
MSAIVACEACATLIPFLTLSLIMFPAIPDRRREHPVYPVESVVPNVRTGDGVVRRAKSDEAERVASDVNPVGRIVLNLKFRGPL